MGVFNLVKIAAGLLKPKSKGEVMSPEELYKIPLKTLHGKPATMEQYRGKPLVIVNTASKCGFTPQYKDLQKIYEEYKGQGLEILGFPCNDFGSQEPGSENDISEFCEINFGVKFPLFEKSPVVGLEKQPVFKYLTEQAKPEFRGEVAWNFEKFLVNKKGQLVNRFRSLTKPDSEKFRQAIQEILK
ncbi:MAG: glutathione peroxidase [Bdellovibrionales bacterium]